MESNQVKESRDRVSRDAIYSQMSNVAMRHRNYEKESATWYTAILSVMMGFILSSKFGASGSDIAQLLSESIYLQMVLAVVILAMALSSSYSTWFFHIQHTCFDKYVDSLLEPEEAEKKTVYLKAIPKLKPTRLIIVVQILIALGTIVLIFLRP